MGYIDQNGDYYEGDRQGSDIEVIQRPSSCHTWNEEWVLDINKALTALNIEYANKLAQIERTAGKAPLLRRANVITEEQEGIILDNLAAQYSSIAQELRQKQDEITGGN